MFNALIIWEGFYVALASDDGDEIPLFLFKPPFFIKQIRCIPYTVCMPNTENLVAIVILLKIQLGFRLLYFSVVYFTQAEKYKRLALRTSSLWEL